MEAAIDGLLLSGRCATASEAESAWLDPHLDDLAALIAAAPDGRAWEHAAVRLLLSHGSRPAEGSHRRVDATRRPHPGAPAVDRASGVTTRSAGARRRSATSGSSPARAGTS